MFQSIWGWVSYLLHRDKCCCHNTALQRKVFCCPFISWKYVAMSMHVCHQVLSVIKGYCAFYFCAVWISVSAFHLQKREAGPICHTREVAFAAAGNLWEIRGIAHLVGVFCTHFSSLLSHLICHMYRSESTCGFIPNPDSHTDFSWRSFWFYRLISGLKPRD